MQIRTREILRKKIPTTGNIPGRRKKILTTRVGKRVRRKMNSTRSRRRKIMVIRMMTPKIVMEITKRVTETTKRVRATKRVTRTTKRVTSTKRILKRKRRRSGPHPSRSNARWVTATCQHVCWCPSSAHIPCSRSFAAYV